jgi:hypothetical protein
MTDKLTLRPVSFSVTYGKEDIEEYLEDCEVLAETPSQEGFVTWARERFENMLEEGVPKVSYFEQKLKSFGFDIETWDIYVV